MRTIKVDSSSEVSRFLDNTGDGPVLVQANGATYRVDRLIEKDSVFANYDVNAVLRAIRATGGALHNVDRGKLLADLRAQRGVTQPS